MLQKVSYLGVPNISSKILTMYKKLDGILQDTDNSEDIIKISENEEIIKNFIIHMLENRISDAVLYSRLSAKCIDMGEDVETDNSIFNLVDIGLEYQEHASEELENFTSLQLLGIAKGFACALDFNLNSSANTKFSKFKEFMDYTQYREMMSVVEFYTLYRILLETDYLDFLDTDTQIDLIQNIQNSLEIELQHFQDFNIYSNVGDGVFEDIIAEITEYIDEGF